MRAIGFFIGPRQIPAARGAPQLRNGETETQTCLMSPCEEINLEINYSQSENRIMNIGKHDRQTLSASAASNLSCVVCSLQQR